MQLYKSREKMAAGKKTIFSFCFFVEKGPRAESLGGSKAYYTAIFTIFILFNSISQCQKNTKQG